MHRMRLALLAAPVAATLALAGCAGGSGSASTAAPSASATDGTTYPITITSALGTATITKKPVRVATVAWTNQEVPLALGVVPVGMPKVTWGDDDGDGVLPWVEDKLKELGAKTPTLFDETSGIDFEAVANTKPDVILAAYSGLTKQDYATLSKIAPVVAYPDKPWTTFLDDTIELDSEALGLKSQGAALVDTLDGEVATAAEAAPDIAGKSAMFAYIDPTDLSKIGFYTTEDPRAAFFTQLGMTTPAVVTKNTGKTASFYTEVSAEEASQLDDVDVIVTYGDSKLLAAMQADPLIGKIPAVERGSVVVLPNSTPLAASANPSPLSIGWGVGKYVDLLEAAAKKA